MKNTLLFLIMAIFCAEKIACMQPEDEQAIAFIDRNLVVRELPSFVNEEVDDSVNSVVFSPTQQQLMIGGDLGNATLWDLATRSRLKTFKGITSFLSIQGREVLQSTPIENMAFSPDGKKLLVNQSDRFFNVWNIDTQQLLCTLSQVDSRFSTFFASFFSPDGEKAFICKEKTLETWNVETGVKIYSKKLDTFSATSAALSPDGTQILIGSIAKSSSIGVTGITLCDAPRLETLKQFPQGLYAISVAFSPDGKQFIASDDKVAKIWDIQSGAVLHTLSHTHKVNIVMFSPPGDKVITAARDTVRIWDAATGRELKQIIHDKAAVISMSVSFDGNTLATATRRTSFTLNAGPDIHGYDSKAKIWDLRGYNPTQIELLKTLRAKITTQTTLSATENQWRVFNDFPENAQDMLQKYIRKPESLKSPAEKLIDAAKKGDLNTVRDLIEKQNVDPLTKDPDGHTAWYYAKQQMNHPMMRYAQELAAKRANQECCVCLEKVGKTQFEIGSPTYECLHFMCKDCRKSWKPYAPNPLNPHVLQQPVCPICRQ